MCQVLIESTRDARVEALRVEEELARRSVDARSVLFGVRRADPANWTNLDVVVAFLPTLVDPHRARAVREIAQVVKGGIPVVGVAVEDSVPVAGLFDQIDGTKDIDPVIERLIDILCESDAAGLRPRALPSIISEPTGIDIWNNELTVADVTGGRVAMIHSHGGDLLIAGGSELHHLSRDRDKLLVCSKAEDAVLAAFLMDGRTGPAFYIESCNGVQLRRPQGVCHGAGFTAIADTDGPHVWLTREDLFADPAGGSFNGARWQDLQLRGQYPMAVARTQEFLWVTTLSPGGVEVFDLRGEPRRVRYLGPRLDHPTSIAVYGRFLLVACADRQVQLLSWSLERGSIVLRVLADDLFGDVLKAPFAIATSSDGRVCITDRGWGCIWTTTMARILYECANDER